MEGSHSGLVHHLGKMAYRKVPRVRISPPPHKTKRRWSCTTFFLFYTVERFELKGGVGRRGIPPVEEIIQNRGF